MFTVLAVTIFIVELVSTRDMCEFEFSRNEVLFNCNKMDLTDNEFTNIFESLLEDKKNEDMIRNYPIKMLVENNALQSLKVMPSIRRLEQLSFKQNRIVSMDVGIFQNLPALRYLDLSHNQLTSSSLLADVFRSKYIEHDDEHRSLPLENLNLENNNISSLSSDVFLYLSNLKSLTLSNNPIRSINAEFEAAFAFLTQLQILSMTQTELSTLPDTFLTDNVISELYMTQNHFTYVPKCFRNIATTLRILNLNGNSIIKLNATSFDGLSNLDELHVSGMETLTEIAKDTFLPLTNLRLLSCSYNMHLRGIDPAAFNGLKSRWHLQELYLNNNDLRDVSNDLVLWNQLKVLHMDGNSWNCTCSFKWFLSFIRKRQNSDPESNLGMRCAYPPELERRSLMYANSVLQCSKPEDEDSFVMASYLTTINLVFVVILILALIVVLYYIVKRVRRARMLMSRYSGVFVQSVTKYKKLARLNDQIEMQTDPEPE